MRTPNSDQTTTDPATSVTETDPRDEPLRELSLRDIAKRRMESALEPVAADLEELRIRLPSYLPCETKTSIDMAQHVFSSRGKLIRPALYFLCCRMLDYRGDHYFPMAAVTEFVHTASLLHDDVVDNSTLRRNKPTPNSVWGDQASVLVGDLVYSRASEMMAETGSLEIVGTYAKAIRMMSEGELLQLENVFNFDITSDTYFQIMANKTAVLIAASCRGAGILAQMDTAQRELLSNFGFRVGIAFQLIDDALDYLAQEVTLGKPTLADLQEGKVTYPIIKLRERATAKENGELRNLIARKKLSEDDIGYIASLVERYDTATEALALAEKYTDEALGHLERMPAGPARDDLHRVASHLLFRFN